MARVLIASPHESLRAEMAAAVEAEGHTTAFASAGHELLTRIEADQPAVAVLDTALDDPPILRLIDPLRHAPWARRVALVLAGPELWSGGEAAEALRAARPDGLLALPCRTSAFVAVLRQSLSVDEAPPHASAATPFAEMVAELAASMDRQSYFELLGVDADASRERLRAYYLRRSLLLHPDRHQRSRGTPLYDQIVEVYKRVNEAYRVLTSPVLRPRYDQALAAGELRLAETGGRIRALDPEATIQDAAARKFFRLARQALEANNPRAARMHLQLARSRARDSDAIAALLKQVEERLALDGGRRPTGVPRSRWPSAPPTSRPPTGPPRTRSEPVVPAPGPGAAPPARPEDPTLGVEFGEARPDGPSVGAGRPPTAPPDSGAGEGSPAGSDGPAETIELLIEPTPAQSSAPEDRRPPAAEGEAELALTEGGDPDLPSAASEEGPGQVTAPAGGPDGEALVAAPAGEADGNEASAPPGAAAFAPGPGAGPPTPTATPGTADLGHLLVIAGGCGEWADDRGTSVSEAVRRGVARLRGLLEAALDRGVGCVSFCPTREPGEGEPGALLEGALDFLLAERDMLQQRGVQLQLVGRVPPLPPKRAQRVAELARTLSAGGALTFALLLRPPGREGVLQALRSLGDALRTGRLAPEAIDATALRSALPAPRLPDVDLTVVATGSWLDSEPLPFRAAEAPRHLAASTWPDLERPRLEAILDEHRRRAGE